MRGAAFPELGSMSAGRGHGLQRRAEYGRTWLPASGTALRGLRHDAPASASPEKGSRGHPGRSLGRERRREPSPLTSRRLGFPPRLRVRASFLTSISSLPTRSLSSGQSVPHIAGRSAHLVRPVRCRPRVSVRREARLATRTRPGTHKPRVPKRRPQPRASKKFRAGKRTPRMSGKTATVVS